MDEQKPKKPGTGLNPGDPNYVYTNYDDWFEDVQPKELNDAHKKIARLLSQGWKQVDIAEKLGMSINRVNILANSPIVRVEVERLHELEFERMTSDVSLERLTPKAVKIIDEVLSNDQERSQTKVDTAFRLLDRVWGKPKQQVEHSNSLVKDLITLLDKAKDAPEMSIEYQPEPNELDKWVNEFNGGIDEEESQTEKGLRVDEADEGDKQTGVD